MWEYFCFEAVAVLDHADAIDNFNLRLQTSGIADIIRVNCNIADIEPSKFRTVKCAKAYFKIGSWILTPLAQPLQCFELFERIETWLQERYIKCIPQAYQLIAAEP